MRFSPSSAIGLLSRLPGGVTTTPAALKYKLFVDAGTGLLEAQDYAGAATVWEKIETLRPMDLLPHQRLMGLYLQLKDWPNAEKELETLSQVELQDNRYVKVLARLYFRSGDSGVGPQACTQGGLHQSVRHGGAQIAFGDRPEMRRHTGGGGGSGRRGARAARHSGFAGVAGYSVQRAVGQRPVGAADGSIAFFRM